MILRHIHMTFCIFFSIHIYYMQNRTVIFVVLAKYVIVALLFLCSIASDRSEYTPWNDDIYLDETPLKPKTYGIQLRRNDI